MKTTMTKTAIAAALLLATGAVQAAPVAWTGTFSMYDAAGVQMDANDGAAGLDADVTGVIDTVAGTFTLASTNTFFGQLWATSNASTMAAGSTYTHSTVDPAPAVSGGIYTGITVATGQLGGAVDFAWGGTTGIDVVMVWDIVGNTYTSSDWNSSGTPGAGMLDGPFGGFSANFNMTAAPSAVPVPAAVWLFGSGLLGLVGVARRKAA